MKGFFVAMLCFFCIQGFACVNALPTNDINFCSSFKAAATCYCTSSGVPAGMCQNMHALYGRMMSMFGSLERACGFQHYTSQQDCVDNWNCYLQGGSDSQGRACSSNHNACQ